MVSFDPIPQARVVRHAGELMTPPPAPRPDPAGAGGLQHPVLVYAIGLWPLTCVVLLVAGLLVLTANLGAP
jgi:hypothetical protein